MYREYFVTGATGYLGSAVVRQLVRQGAQVRALLLYGDESELPAGVRSVYGRVDERASLEHFFDGAGEDSCVIHCAGIVSILSQPGDALRRVNVIGTQNVVALCRERRVGRLIYVSSVHAIAEKPAGEQISEVTEFSAESVSGAYAKSKAEATGYVLAAAREGFPACVVHPSGIIGPGDPGNGSITSMIRSYCKGKMRLGVRGGYDFVDVNDVADGVLACCERGRSGECYILSNRYVSMREFFDTLAKVSGRAKIHLYVPLGVAKLIAPLSEKLALRRKKNPFLTRYSIETLGTNALFSHDKATRELGYRPRALEQTLAATVAWLRQREAPAKYTPRRLHKTRRVRELPR